MKKVPEGLSRPIRVVVFSGGPGLEKGVQAFLCRLEDHPEIELVACICQSVGQSLTAVMEDLWRRRGLLAIPLAAVETACKVGRAFRPNERAIIRKLDGLSERIFFVPDMHADDVLSRVRDLSPDLGLIYGGPILKPSLFEIPIYGTLGIHHGMAPKYRGKKTTFWEVYNGEKNAGVIIQKVSVGLDTGDILRQGGVPIGKSFLGSVKKKVHAMGLDLFIDAIVSVKLGEAVYRPQEGAKGKLYRDPGIRDFLGLWWRIFLGRRRNSDSASTDTPERN